MTRRLHALPCLVLFLAALTGARAGVTPFPSIPGLVTSPVYRVEADGQQVWTEQLRTNFDLRNLPDWFLGSSYVNGQQEVHIANLASDGPFRVRITVPAPITKAAVRPASRRIAVAVAGGALEFTAPGPDWYYITIDDLPPLLLFAHEPETDVPAPGAPQLRYFGPGVHRPGIMELHSGDSVYLAPGAIVHGAIRAAPETTPGGAPRGVAGIRIFGRGILDGDAEHELLRLRDARFVTVDGITMRNGSGWMNTLENCEDVIYRGVKLVSFGPSGDGIDPVGSRRVRIHRCFFRCTDDCIAIKAYDPAWRVDQVHVSGCTLVGFAYSDGVTIGFETNAPEIANVTVRNCDILQARGGSRVDGHSAFSIICDGPAHIRGIRYEDIRVEEDVLKLFELHVTDGTKYDVNPPGRISDVRLVNVAWASRRPVILRGFGPDNRVSGVVFEGCSIAGEPLAAPVPGLFQVNEFVDGVRFLPAPGSPQRGQVH